MNYGYVFGDENINPIEQNEWHKTELVCMNCGHTWDGMVYDATLIFQCPNCKRMQGVRTIHVEAKERIQEQIKKVMDFQIERAMFPGETIDDYNKRMTDRDGQENYSVFCRDWQKRRQEKPKSDNS